MHSRVRISYGSPILKLTTFISSFLIRFIYIYICVIIHRTWGLCMKKAIREYIEYVYIKNGFPGTLIINKKDLHVKYPQIGEGDEGIVYQYNDKLVFKTFERSEKDVIPNKFKKVELLMTEKDEAFEFPCDFVFFMDGEKSAYTMNFIETREALKSFLDLIYITAIDIKYGYFKKAEEAIKRAHGIGIILGDIKGNHILINKEDNLKFVDTDNFAVGPYGFDTIPRVSKLYERIHHNKCSLIDNDKFTFSLLALYCYFPFFPVYEVKSFSQYKELMNYLDISKHSKEMLLSILSDAPNKLYVCEALREFEIDKPLLKKGHSNLAKANTIKR